MHSASTAQLALCIVLGKYKHGCGTQFTAYKSAYPQLECSVAVDILFVICVF